MKREELVGIKDPVSCGSSDPPSPPHKPGCECFPIPQPPDAVAFQAEESILHISEDEAKEAFVEFAASKCCYLTAPAKQMVVQSLAALNTYRYQLQTFTESRTTLPAFEPYKGGFVDSEEIGVPPGPWDVVVEPPPLFTDCTMHLPVPHTYSVQACPRCFRTGCVLCIRCGGSGRCICVFCGGSGRSTYGTDIYSVCPHCSGSGRVRCLSCHGEGQVPCAHCDTTGLLLCHVELAVTWRNNVTKHVVDKNQGFPLSRFQKVTGKELFSEEQDLVTALNLPQPMVQGAESCLALHQQELSEETRILRQKHSIEIIPLTKVDYEWKGQSYSFYIFGNEKKVYAKGYPGRCCCALL